MGLKRWNKILAAFLCFSMAFSEPSTMVLASPVVEESIAEEGEIVSGEADSGDSVQGDVISENLVQEDSTSDNAASDNMISDNVVPENTESENEIAAPDDTVPDSEAAEEGALNDTTEEIEVSTASVSEDGVSENTISINAVSDNAAETEYYGVMPDDLVIESLEEQLGSGRSAVARSASLYEDVTGAELPAQYDARNYGYVTEPRHQSNSLLCWAFSASSVIESNMLKKQFEGADKDTLQISPGHLGYFFYHHVDDELGGTAGASIQVEGTNENYYTRGGNTICATFELAGWVGPVEEAKAPFVDGRATEYDDSIAYDDISHMQNAYWVKASDKDYIKALITEFGSVTVNCKMEDSGKNIIKCDDGTASYFYQGTDKVNHAITIIGWDDNYPKSNFKSCGNTDTSNNNRPASEDGAWLIKDSYGNDGSRVNGCFYMSYEDAALGIDSNKAVVYDVEGADNYDHNYFYDAACGLQTMAFRDSIYGANVFQAKGNKETGGESIEAVSFATASTAASYSIQIYTGLRSPQENPTSGRAVFAEPQTGSFAYAGYHTVKLDTPVMVPEGEYFSVVISLEKEDGTVSFMTDESYSNGWAKYTAAVEPGRSFYGTDGLEWTDAAKRVTQGEQRPSVMRIKAFTRDSEMIGPYYVDADMVPDIKPQTYTGEQIIPDVKVYYGTRELKKGIDYSISYGRNIEVGKNAGSVTIRGIGNYITESTITKRFNIVKKNINDEEIRIEGLEDCYYNGAAQKPVKVYHNDRLLADKSVRITYRKNRNEGTAYVTIKGRGNYTGSRKATFKIRRHDVASGTISVNQIRDVSYAGKPIQVRPEVRDSKTGMTLKLNRDYTLLYRRNVMPGTASVTVTGKGGYGGSTTLEFRILGRDIAKLPMSTIKSQPYNGGEEIRPDVIIKDGKDTLKENVHFTAVYSNNFNAGTAKINIEGKDGTIYEGTSRTVTFTIAPVNVATGVKLSRVGDKTYVSGKGFYTQEPVLTLPNGKVLTEDTDYTIRYADNTARGNATMTISGVGPNYTGSIVKNFQITDRTSLADYSDANIVVTGFTYDRKYLYDKRDPGKDGEGKRKKFEAKPELTVSYRGVKLEEGKDYTISYRNCDRVGTAQAVITAVPGGRFAGTRIEEYFIIGRPIFPLGLDVGFALNDPVDKVYTGSEIFQNLVLTERIRNTSNDKIISFQRKEGTTYTVEYRDNVNAGKATYTITGINDYSGSEEFEFRIEPKNLETCVASKVKTQRYTGEPICPNVYLKCGKNYLVEGKDYDVEYFDNKNEGRASIVLTACKDSQNFVGAKTISFAIKKTPLSSLKYGSDIDEIEDQVYDGTQKTPVPVLSYCGRVIPEDQYAVTYGLNKKIGWGTITVTALPSGDFSGKKVIRFRINGKSFNVATAYDGEEAVYTGKALRPVVNQIMTLDGETLTKGKDYKIKYKKSVDAGEGYLYLQGLGDYKGSVKLLSYKVQPRMVQSCIIKGLDKTIKKGGKRTVRPPFTVKVDGRKLKKGKDYTVTYMNNRAVGTASIVLRFVGNYDGTYTYDFTIQR